ncbi:MAG TPA: hypothetical protein VFF13_06750 [archaeon]|nr:hypothetical protein [archaeon]
MSESQALGIRLRKGFLEKIEKLTKEENLDRSTTMRILMEEGYESHVKKKAAKDYIAGKITLSKAAEIGGTTIFEFGQYLIGQGFKSQYSTIDLKEELAAIRTGKHRQKAKIERQHV